MKKALPTGVMNYNKLKLGGYYSVDKSMMIHEFLQRRSEVTLITRPRRFGKTLNMSMMAEFFDNTKDSKEIFRDTEIMNTEYAKEMNQYPTIFISFLNAKDDIGNVIKYIKEELLREYDHFSFIIEKLRDRYQRKYHKLMEDLENTNESLRKVNDAISFLAICLNEYYDKKVMVLIDEYDTPFVEAHIKGFYDEIHADIATLLRTVLKGNDALQYAMLTGIQRVAKENIFSDLNNLDVYTVKDEGYAQYFGFTKEETKELLEYYNLDYDNQVKTMYDGYRMGNVDIYNPWSIINYAKRKELIPYWVNTSGNKMIKTAMEDSDNVFKEGYEELIEKGCLETQVNMETSFYEQSNTRSLWGLFVNAGYLTVEEKTRMNQYRIRIPNNEVREEFMSLTAHYLKVSDTSLTDMFSALEQKKEKRFIQTYESILLRMPSYNDLSNENSYHMMMLGMCAWLQNDYTILSNREEGKGRCDIVLSSKKNFLPSFVIEFKYMKKEEFEKHPESLKKLAHDAINQIEENKYDIELTGEVIHIGLAHAGKTVAMQWVETLDVNFKK